MRNESRSCSPNIQAFATRRRPDSRVSPHVSALARGLFRAKPSQSTKPSRTPFQGCSCTCVAASRPRQGSINFRVVFPRN